MLRTHSEKERRFTRADKSDSMMKENLFQLKPLRYRICNQSHLMFSHRLVSFVIDPLDFTALFQLTNNSPKIDHRPRPKIGVLCRSH